MAMATYSTYKAKEGGGVYPRDASFSSYLDSTERDFVRNLAASIHNQSPARESLVTPRASVRKNQIPRTELDVFGAERYFNEKLDDQKMSPSPRKNRGVRNKQKYRRDKIIDLLEIKSTKSSTISTISSLKSPTPSFKSEGSYKSQFGGMKILSGLQCKDVCVDKSIYYTTNNNNTQEKVQSPKAINKGDNNRYRESNKVSHQEHFAFPIIEDQPRKSLEVFGFQHVAKQDIAQTLERKLSILAWDAIPNSQNNPFPFPFPSNKKKSLSINNNDHHEHEHDTRSEASSDLFEIEHLSGIPTSQTSYATSEASIEWSVVTASAADFSMFSGYQDDEKVSNASKSTNKKKNSTMEKIKVQKKSSSLGGGLLGCKSYKAIDVVGSFSNRSNNVKKN